MRIKVWRGRWPGQGSDVRAEGENRLSQPATGQETKSYSGETVVRLFSCFQRATAWILRLVSSSRIS